MKIKYISLAMLATVFAASCSNEEIVETNVGPMGEAIDFRPSVVSNTRATATTIANLGHFNVYAKGIHKSGSLFTPFLIGDNTTGKPGIAKRGTVSEDVGKWTLANDVYWPSDIDKALFWAFSDLRKDEEVPASGLCVNGVVKFENAQGPSIENYTPTKADLNKVVTNDQGWYDGDNQRDLVSAFRQQTKNPHVSLDFHHLLSQIEITASSKRLSDDKNNSRQVTIKGAWVVNVAASGTLSAGFDYDKDTQDAKDKPSWTYVTDADKLQSYGTYYVGDRIVPVIVQNSTTNSPLNALGINGRGNLMLIPQQMGSWDGTSATTTGAYLLLLCRVELQHTGVVAVEPGEPIYSPDDGTGYHYHQLFPVLSKYDKTAYGLSAIPIPVDWEMGKKYTYSLDMCGTSTGAGKYPPNVPTETAELVTYLKKFIPGTPGTDYQINATEGSDSNKVNVITQIPKNKGVGDYVLDDPIQFEVTVSDWADGGTWVNGNDSKSNAASEE